MYVPEIIEVKKHLEMLQSKGLIKAWELPYENILTRRSAAIFFVTPSSPESGKELWKELSQYANMSYRENAEKKLSQLEFRVTFSKEESEKNNAPQEADEVKSSH